MNAARTAPTHDHSSHKRNQEKAMDQLKGKLAEVAEQAKQKAASVDVGALKFQLDAAGKTAVSKWQTARAGLQNVLANHAESTSARERGESSDEAANEDSRLVRDESATAAAEAVKDRFKAGLSAFGSKLEAFKSQAQVTMNNAKQASSKGVDGLRGAAAAGSAGVENLRSATADAKGRCGEALSAAAAVSGVSLPSRKKPPETRLGKLCAFCPALTYRQRLIGAISCLVLGTLLSLFSLGSIAQLILGNPLPFAFKYTLGNVLSLSATSFLVGPQRQLRDMLQPSRRFASLAYLAMLVLTLVSALVLKVALLSLIFVLLQAAALTWYMLSYVPYGRVFAKRIVQRVLRRYGLLTAAATSEQGEAADRGSPMSPAAEEP